MAGELNVVAVERVSGATGEGCGREFESQSRPFSFVGPSPNRLGHEAAQLTQPRQKVHACVAWLLQANSADHAPLEKRVHRRYTFRKPLSVTPVNNTSGRPDRSRSFTAFGIDISPNGICFVARQLVPARRAVLTLEGPGAKTVSLLFEPRWVRFTRGGWYQTGGRLLEVLPQENEPLSVLHTAECPADIEELCKKSRNFRPEPL